MPKLDLTREQLASLREAFIFGVEDRAAHGLDDEEKAIVTAIDRALAEPELTTAQLDISAGLASLRKQADEAVANLTPREREVLTQRFGVKVKRQTLHVTTLERELLIEALRRATYEAQQAFDHANSQTELIGNKEVLDAYQKSVTDMRALLVRVQELINS